MALSAIVAFAVTPALEAQTTPVGLQPLTPEQQRAQDAQAAVAATGCAACGTGILILIVTLVAINIAILVWVARDAKSRGMDSSALWMLLVFFTHLIGLIIYLFSRPQGALVECQHCHNKRLAVSAKCPHCGNA